MKKYLKLFAVYFLFITILFGLYYFVNHLYIIGLDSSSQYIPFLNDFKSIFSEGNSFFYNWHLGLGDNYLPHFAYYIGSLISALFALITPNILTGYNFLILIKITFIAMAMFGYLDYHHPNKKRSFYLALCYSLSSFVVVYAEFHNWLDIIALLPLLALASDYWLDTHKRGYLISIVTAFLFLSNYVFSIYVFIFMIFYMFYRFFTTQSAFKLSDLLLKIIQYLAYCLLGFAFVAWLIIPVAYAMLFNSAKTTNANLLDSIWNTHFNLDQIWVSLFNSGSAYTFNLKASNYALLYSGLFPLALLPFSLIKKAKKQTLLNFLFLFFCLSPYLLEGMNILFNFMYTPIQFPFRYSFVSIFGIILLSANVDEQQMSNKKIIAWLGFMLISFILYFRLCGYFNDITVLDLNPNKITVLLNSLILIIMAFALIKKKEILLLLIICLDLGSNAYYSNLALHQNTNFHFYKTQMSKFHYQSYPQLDKANGLVYYDFNKSNAALYNHQAGSVLFSSSMASSNFDIADTLKINQATPALISFSGRTALYDLLGVEYLSYQTNHLLIDPGFELNEKINNTSLFQNQDYYNKGFITGKYILESEFEQLPLYKKDLVMLDCAILKEPNFNLQHLDLTAYDAYFEEKVVELKDYVYDSDYLYYLELPGKDNLNLAASLGKDKYYYKDQFFFDLNKHQSYVDESIYYLGNLDGKVKLTAANKEVSGPAKLITLKKQAYLDLVSSHTDDFSQVTISNNKITYEINEKKTGQFIVSTIPTDAGWRGADFTRSHGGLLAFEITTPSITLKFIPYGFILGSVVSLISTSFLFFLIKRGRKNVL